MRSQAATFGLNSLNRIPFASTFTREECIGRRYDSATSLRELDRFLGTLETGVANRLYALHHPPSPSHSPSQPPPAPEKSKNRLLGDVAVIRICIDMYAL
jgi:hypothetical protein